MRGHRVLELEETPENALLCAPEGRHLGAGGCAAKDGYKGDDQQLTQVMSRVLGTGTSSRADRNRCMTVMGSGE